MEKGNWWDKYKIGDVSEEEPKEVAPPTPEKVAAKKEEAPAGGNWWDKYAISKPAMDNEDAEKTLLSNWDSTTQQFEDLRSGYEGLGSRYEELSAMESRTPEQERDLQDTWNKYVKSGLEVQSALKKVETIQPEVESFNNRQKQKRVDYIESQRGSAVFGNEVADSLYEIDARADLDYEKARGIPDKDKRKEAFAKIRASYQTEEAQLLQSRIDAFKENETKIGNAAEVIGQAFSTQGGDRSSQTIDQFLLETSADVEEYAELRDSLLNQDDPEKGKLFREASLMNKLAEGIVSTGVVNGEVRISPSAVWNAELVKSEIAELDVSDAQKQLAIASIPRMQEEAAKLELPFLQKVNEFNAFVKKNNLQGESPKDQISEWKSRTRNWSEMITKTPAQVGIGLTQGALGLLEAGQAIVGGTAMTMGAQKFADPFLDAATQTSERNQELGRISQEIGGPTLLAELAAVAPQIALQIGTGKAVGFGGSKLGLKPKTVSNLGFGSSVGTAMAQSYGNVLSSAFQQLEKDKIDAGMDPIQARAEAIKEAQLPAALSGLSTAIVTAIGGKRGIEAPFREGVDGIRAKLNTSAFRAELPRLIPDVIKGMRNEGYEELADQLAQGIIEQFTFNPELSTSDIINNAVKALVIGGITGGTVEGLKYGFDYMRAPKEMARREASMASIRQSITDAEKDISAASASSPIGSEFQREYDATLPSDEAAKLGAIAVDRTKMSSLQAERQELAELLEDETISKVARNQLEGKLAAADVAYYNEVLAPMRRNVVNEQLVDQLDGMAVSQQTKDSIVALSKIANGLGAESLTGRERVAVGITSIGEGRFLASKKNPMVEVSKDGQATVTEAGRLMAENVGMVPLVRMIGLSESTRAKQAEMERIMAELEAKKAQQEAKDTAESEDAKRYGPASAEALKQQVAAQPTVPETQSNARLAQLLKEQEEAARLGEEAVARAVETRFIESFRSTMSESIVPTMERAATIDLNAFQDIINSIAREIDKGTFNIELIEQGEFKNILPESAFTTVVEAFKESPQRALNALRAFGDEVENAVKEFGGGAAGEPPENLEPLRRVVRTEQTPEDVAALTEAGLIEIYKDQPVLTQAGIDALPEAERPRLNPEARKIQIDTGSNEVVAEAISKGLRIGVDQVGPNVRMPEGWTLDGDIYIPPAPVVEPPVAPPAQPPLDESVTIFNYDERAKPIQDQIDSRIDELMETGMSFNEAQRDPSVNSLREQRLAMDRGAINSYRDIVTAAFEGQGITNNDLTFVPAFSILEDIYASPRKGDEGLIAIVSERGQEAFNNDAATIRKLSKAIFKYRAEAEGMNPEELLGPNSGLTNEGKQARVNESRTVAEAIHNQIKNSLLGQARVQPPVAPPVTLPPIAPIAGAITEEQANKAVKAAQKERAKKSAPNIENSDWGPKSVPTKIIAGGTARQALITASRLNLSKIAQSNPNEIMMQDVAAILAELKMPILDLESVATLSSLKAKGRPRRWPGIGSVIGMPSTIPMPVKNLVHELGHTLTADQIRRYLPRKKTGSGKAYLDALNKAIADPKTPEAVSRLFSLYVSTIDQLGITEQYFGAKGVAGTPRADTSKAMAKRLQAKGLLRKDLKGDSLYGFANVEEFVSQTFSETPFRDLLKTLKDPTNPQRTLWQAFVDAIQAILQLPKGSMAAGVIQASVDVGMTVPSDRELGGRKKGTATTPAPRPSLITPEESARFMELAKDPEANREELQKMVDNAAKRIGIDIREIRDAAGYMKSYADDARESGNYDASENASYDAFERATKAGLSDIATQQMLSDVSTGLELETAVQDAIATTQIKSADPVTYDADGNIIPLEDRFDETRPEIDSGAEPDMAYAGEQANLPQFMLDSLSVAQAMAARNADPQTIRRITGWIVNPYDKKLRWEIPDNNAQFTNAWYNLKESPVMGTPIVARLGDILSHPPLFKAYPEIADVTIIKRPAFLDFFKSIQGSFDDTANQISVTPYAVDQLSTILHEIQHWIQNRENFARGSNTEKVMKVITPNQKAAIISEMNKKADDMAKILKEKLDKAWKLRDYLRGIQAIPEQIVAFDLAVQEKQRVNAEWRKVMDLPTGSPEKTAVLDADREAQHKLWRAAGIDPKDALQMWDIAWPLLQAESLDQILNETDAEFNKLEKDISSSYQIIADASKGDDEFKAAIDKFDLSHELYRRVAGEIEARDVQSRAGMTPEERTASEPYSSENIAPELAIVTFSSPSATTEEADIDMAPEPEEAPTGIVEGQEVQLEGGDLLRAMKTQSETQYAGKIGRISGKEIFQNSVDAIMKITPQQEAQRGVPKAIYVGTQSKFFRSKLSSGERANLENRKPSDEETTDERILRGDDLVVYDTGTGMTPNTVIDKFLRAFVSGKTVGEGGGFGQAKLAFLGGSKYFKVATVAEDANGKKYVTILEGAGEAFYLFNMKPPKVVLRPMTKITLATPTDGIPMTLEYFEVPADTITGTAIVSEVPKGFNDGAGGGKDFISDVVKYVDGISFLDMDSVKQSGSTISERGTFHIYSTSRNNPLEFIGFSTPDVSALNPIKMEFGLLKSIDLPSATIDFLARANDAYGKRTYISAKVLNRSIYQFDDNIYFDEEVSLPNEVVVNIKPKVEAGSKDYPFTTSRENLSGDVRSEVSQYFKSVGREAIKKLNAQFDAAIKTAIPIPNSSQAFLDVGQNNDAATLNAIVSASSTAAINEDIAYGQEQILRTLNTMYPNKFGRATYAGFITGGRSFGVHFGTPRSSDPSTIWHDPWLQLSRAKDTWKESSFADPAYPYFDFDTATDKEINDFYDFYLRQSYGVSFHEALHQIVDEEGEGLARELTFRTGDLLYGFLTSSIPNNRTVDEKRAILKELETNADTLASNVNQTIASQFITAQGGYSGYALAQRGRQETTRTEAGRLLPEEGVEPSPEEEFDIVPEQVEDQIEGTPEAAVIKVMGQAFQMANEQSATAGTPQGTIPLETITSAWMNSGRDVETLENAIIRYTNLDPEVAATLAEAISQQVEIQRGIMDIADAARSRKAEQDEEPEIKPYSFANRIKGELPPALRSKIQLVYEVLRNDVSVQEANQAMSGLTVDEAIRATEDMNNGISFPVRSMMVQIVLRKIMAQRRATKGKRGKEADYEAAVEAHVNFFNFTNNYFKELGQGVQAIARFSDLGADGILLKVRKDVDKAISKHITNRKGQIDQIKRDVEEADSAAFKAALNANKNSMDSTADKAGKQEAKIVTIEEQAQKLAQRAAKKVAGEEIRRRQPDPLSELVNGHLRRYNANFVAEATAMGVSPVTAQAIEDSAIKLRDSRKSAKAERERFKDMQDERLKVKKELARENKYIYGERPTIWEDYQEMFSERLARRLMRDPKKKIPPSLLLFTDRLTENLLGFVPEAKRQATTQRSFQAMIEDALNNKEKYQEAFNKAMEDISLKVMELEARAGGGEAVSSSAYKKALAAQEFMERLEPIIQQFPVSDKLIIRFVNQKTKAIGESITAKYNQWYRSSKKTRSEIEMELAQKLVEDINVSDSDAIKLSRAIIKDFRAKAEERREKALARFKKPKEKSKRLKESPLKTFFELVNIGAMTDRDAYEVMAHRFELPTWDTKFAKQIEDMAKIVQDMPEGLERRRLTRNMMAEIARRKGFSLSDLGSGFFYSNMLSDIETFLINFYDTLFGNWVNGLASSVAEKDFARLNGLMAGYRKGWREAINVFNTGLRINMPRLEEKTPLTVELTNYGYKGGVALESTEGMNAIAKTLLESPPARALNLWKYVTRIMEATDALNYTASAEGQRYAEAAKMARDEGLEGKEKQKRINQILNLGDAIYQAALKQAEKEGYTGNDAKFRAMEIQDSEIDAEIREKSFERALTDVYRNMPTGLAGFMAAQFNNITMRIANPWFRNAFKLLLAPFVITPTNLFNRWLDYSPYGYKRLFYGSGNLLDKDTPYYVAPPKVGSAEFYTQALKASSSVMVMGLAYGLTKAGLLVLRGMGPSDEEERKQWLDDNNRPHTFSFMGGPQISYQYTPWALVLSWMANYQNWEQYNAKEDASGVERGIVAMTAATSVIMDLPFFAGPAEFMNAIQGGRGAVGATLQKYAEGKMGMVFPNLVRKIDRIFDPTLYDSQGLKGIIIDQMPFARRLGTQRVNLFGDPIGEDKPTMDRLVGRIISFPTNPSRESRILAKYDIYPYMPSPQRAKALVDGEEAQMTEEQYNEFVKIVGSQVKQEINGMFDPEGEVSETEMKLGKKRISQIFEKARARGVREVSY